MECSNLNCKYNLSKNEEHYLCCPICGEIISKNMEEKTSFDRLQAYEKIITFQRYLDKEKTAVKIFLYVWCIIEMFSAVLTVHHIRGEDSILTNRSVYQPRVVSMFVLLPIFFSYKKRYKYSKAILGEIVFVCQKLPFKIIKWMILFGIAMFMSICIIPNYYGFCMDIIESFKPNEVAVKALTFLYYVSFWYICIGIVLFDISDVYRRKFCESMSESCDSGVNL